MQSDIFKRKPIQPDTDIPDLKYASNASLPVHTHKHYWTENKGTYEPVVIDDVTHYKFVMYSYSACNCGESAKRTKIQDEQL